MGSWEAFNARMNDARGCVWRNETFQKKAFIQDETDDNIRPWLGGLVQEEGFDRAHDMLSMAGYIPPQQ